MAKSPTALVEGQKLSVVLEYSNAGEGFSVTDIIELTEPSQPLEPELKTVKVLGLDDEKVVTLIDGESVSFERAESSLDPMLTLRLLAYMLEGRTFRTER